MAYHDLPMAPMHNNYLCVFWRGGIYIQHITIEGLPTASGIQGGVADAMVTLMKFHSVIFPSILHTCTPMSLLTSHSPKDVHDGHKENFLIVYMAMGVNMETEHFFKQGL